MPIIINAAAAPLWAAGSGLALDEAGAIAVDECQRSTSHPDVLVPRSKVTSATRGSDAAVTRNMLAVLAGMAPAPLTLERNPLTLLASGDGRGIAQWGRFCAQGRWVGWLKRHLDQRRIARLPVANSKSP
jgi:hypothetical protein